jgi:hypothetical protein
MVKYVQDTECIFKGEEINLSTALQRQQRRSYDEQPDRFIRLLRLWGVRYLVSDSSPRGRVPVVSPAKLIRTLAVCQYPRIRDASISLYVLHPELADAILEVYETGTPAETEEIAVLTLATLYLQRLWSFQLTVALGHAPNFPEQPFEHFWQERHLPSPACQNGNIGLYALQKAEQERRGLPLNFIADWQNQIDHLLLQEKAFPRDITASIILPRVPDENDEEQECGTMSMRPNVTKADIESFLKELGRSYRKAGRLYIAGGAALVHMGLRSGTTMDIAISIEAANEDEMVAAIRRIVDQSQINIEFASPGDFIPLPAQWMSQAHFVGRYGSIDVFYFDFYSLALSKISRGSDRDLIDVQLLLRHHLITLDGLDVAVQEILPRKGKRPYINLNPQRFSERYMLVRQKLQSFS